VLGLPLLAGSYPEISVAANGARIPVEGGARFADYA
jgi:hypothetical protein